MASLIGNLLGNQILRTGLNYLIKGGLVTGASNVFMSSIRNRVKSSLRFSVIQVLFFGFMLLLIDYILPRFLPFLKPQANVSSETNGAANLISGITNLLSGPRQTKEEQIN